jgi:hypothetical protein
MNRNPKNSAVNNVKETGKKYDLNLLTIYFLYRHQYLNTKQADICMYAGISNLLQLKEIFDNHKEDLLLKIPGCNQEILNVYRNLSYNISNPETVAAFFERLSQGFESYTISIERNQRIDEMIQLKALNYKEWVSRKKEVLSKLEESEFSTILKGKLGLFMNHEKMSMRLQNVLRGYDFKSAMEIIDWYLDDRDSFLKLRNFGQKAFIELTAICDKYIEKFV